MMREDQKARGGDQRGRTPLATWKSTISSVSIAFAFLLIWEIMARASFLGLRIWLFVPPPSAAIEAGVELALEGELVADLIASGRRLLAGYVPGALLGGLVGLVVGWSRVAGMVFGPILNLLRPMPKPVLMPLLLIVFGANDASKAALIGIGVFFLVAFASMYGARAADQRLLESMRILGMSESALFFRVGVKYALPYIASGMRLALGVSYTYLVFAELLAATDGLGHLVASAQSSFAYPRLFAGIMTLSLVGGSSLLLFAAVERRLLSWYYATRSPGAV